MPLTIHTHGSYGNPKDDSDYRPTTEADIQRAISEHKMFTLSKRELDAIIERNTDNEFGRRTAAKAAKRVLCAMDKGITG
jgi:hypothetical protein